MAKKIFPLIVIFVAALLLFYPVFGVYFSGDDFFHFKVALAGKGLGFYPFEKFGIAFWRPLFREGLYSLFYHLFGLNHLPFRIFQFVIHFANIALVYLLTQRLFGKRILSLVTCFFFAVSAANVGALYYLAGGIQAQGALIFILLALLFWPKHKVLGFGAFVLGLASHELAVTTPFLLVGLVWIQKKKFKVKNYSFLIPFLLMLIVYLLLNIFVIGFSSREAAYQLNFSPKALVNTYTWYAAWALGLPEMTVDFVLPGLKLNSNLMAFWGSYYQIIFPAFFLSLVLIIYFFIKNLKILKDRKFQFLIFWFVVGLLPVVFLPIHKKTYYLQPVLPAFWVIVSYLIYRTKPKLLLIVSLLFLILNVTSIKLADKTYWAANRGRVAQKLIDTAREQYPTLPKGGVVYFKNDPDYPTLSGDWQDSSKQAYFALNGSDALQLLYHDPTLQVYYEDIEIPPSEAFELVAKIK